MLTILANDQREAEGLYLSLLLNGYRVTQGTLLDTDGGEGMHYVRTGEEGLRFLADRGYVPKQNFRGVAVPA